MIPEHVFGVSPSALVPLLDEAGLVHHEFAAPVLAGDVAIVASLRGLQRLPDSSVAEALLSSPSGRLVVAMQDLQDKGHRPVDLRKNLSRILGVRKCFAVFMESVIRWVGKPRSQFGGDSLESPD